MSKLFALVLMVVVLVLPVHADSLLVAAASDLASVEEALTEAFAGETGHEVQFVLQSSGMLARQIQNGAPYDVYLSANEMYVRELATSGDLESGSIRTYAIGRLGLWSQGGQIKDLKQLTSSAVRRVAIANPAHAPYGVAARQTLQSAGLWERLQPKLVLAENVRQTLQYGESGNVDAIITSWTLVRDRGGVQVPADLHDPIRQAGGVIRRSGKAALGRRFLEFLVSEAGQGILSAHGLQPVP